MSKKEIEQEEDITLSPFGAEEGETAPMAFANTADEEQSQVKVRGDDGKMERKKRAVSLGISELLLPPYSRREIAIYKIKSSSIKDPSTGDYPLPTNDEFAGRYRFFDKYVKDPAGKWKTMFNLGGLREYYNDASGKTELRHTVEPVVFNNGILRVNTQTNYRLYVFMELHPNNGTNRNRPHGTPIYFERIDIRNSKSEVFKLAEMDLSIEAEQSVRKLSRDQLIGFAVTAGIATAGRQTSEISVDLRNFARNNPKKFFSLNNNISPAIRMDVLDAQSLGLIEYDTDKHRWFDCDTEEKLHVVSVDEDPIESLVEALKKDSVKHEFIKSKLDYWEVTP